MLKIKEDIDLKVLEKFGFEINERYVKNGMSMYVYEFLTVSQQDRSINISSGVDELNGNKEVIKLFDLIQANLVENIVEC